MYEMVLLLFWATWHNIKIWITEKIRTTEKQCNTLYINTKTETNKNILLVCELAVSTLTGRIKQHSGGVIQAVAP